MRIQRRLAALLLILVPAVAAAHHGSSISYDTDNLWTTWATVTQFNYRNPHPTMTFDRILKDGTVEHWVSELGTSPASAVRGGWGRSRSEQAMKLGTRVKLYIGTGRAGGMTGIIDRIENEKGEYIVGPDGNRPAPKSVDMDGVALGRQPSGPDKLVPGQAKD